MGALRPDRRVVPADQLHRLFPLRPRHRQPQEDFLRHRGRQGGMSFEMAGPCFIQRKPPRLADVVEQHDPAQQRLCRDGGDGAGGVAPDVIEVVGGVLVEADERGQLRYGGGQHLGEPQQRFQHLFPAEHPGQFGVNPFPGDPPQHRAAAAEGGRRLPVGRQPQPGDKP